MYRFIIPHKKIFTHQVFAYGIILLNIAGLVLFNIINGERPGTMLPLVIVTIFILLFDIYQYKTKNRIKSIGLIILLCGVIWMTKSLYQPFFIDLALWALYIIARRKLEITVSAEQVSYPSFPKKNIPWTEISNVILRADILTIDLKNNKIYQHEIEYPETEVNEQEFNEFCREQLVHS